jgi:superfamily II DNA or RNA helicase
LAYYRFGLTASEYRSDGLIETMFHILGPKVYEIDQDDPRLSTMTPRVEFVETDFTYGQGIDEDGEKEMLSCAQMYKAMREDWPRNVILCRALTVRMVEGDYCLVLGDSLEHLENLMGYVKDASRPAAFICGETPKKEREKVMADMRAGRINFLFATYALAKLGLDIPRLNKLVLATPHRDKTSIQQAVGRIMRPFEGKQQPVVYDLYDSRMPTLVRWARERVRVYQGLGCAVEGGPRVRYAKNV